MKVIKAFNRMSKSMRFTYFKRGDHGAPYKYCYIQLLIFMHTNTASFPDHIFSVLYNPLRMAFSFSYLLFLLTCLLLMGCIANAQFLQSRAAYYPNSSKNGTDHGACGFGSFGATVNGGDVSAASDLYRNGIGCGACYQVRCTNRKYCSDNGVTVVITDLGFGAQTAFILSIHAFSKMARTTDAAASLLSLGVVDINYRRVSCRYPGKNILVKIDESSSYPSYLAFVIYYQQGQKDITAVQLCETQSFTCKLLQRNHGAVWTSTHPPSGPLSLRMLFSDGDESNDKWVVPVNNIPQDWQAGSIYDSGVQVN